MSYSRFRAFYDRLSIVKVGVSHDVRMIGALDRHILLTFATRLLRFPYAIAILNSYLYDDVKSITVEYSEQIFRKHLTMVKF